MHRNYHCAVQFHFSHFLFDYQLNISKIVHSFLVDSNSFYHTADKGPNHKQLGTVACGTTPPNVTHFPYLRFWTLYFYRQPFSSVSSHNVFHNSYFFSCNIKFFCRFILPFVCLSAEGSFDMQECNPKSTPKQSEIIICRLGS